MESIQLSAEQRTALLLAYQSAAPRLGGMGFDDFAIATRLFDVCPTYARGRMCGAILVHGSEVHACILPWARGLWFDRRAARVLNDVIEKHGEATTSATTEQGRQFVERLGFIKHGSIFRSTKKWALKPH